MKADIGVIGLGVMGRALAQNLERNGLAVALFNRTHSKAVRLQEENRGKRFIAVATLKELAEVLSRPRKILLMVPAGKSVDQMIQGVSGGLEADDILIDGGNSHYTDTERRILETAGRGPRFVGMGISGGEEGALYGPSLMPGGDPESYGVLQPILEKIAARSDSGPCVTYVGNRGAGHFVKMVHNGIEYGIMQLIAETYDLLRNGLGLDGPALEDLFGGWNRGDLQSYLIEITAKIINFPDDLGDGLLIDRILDLAGQKGTGAWTTVAAGELGLPVPTITSAVEARGLSALREERLRAGAIYTMPDREIAADDETLVQAIHDALYVAILCAYSQGFALIRAASDRFEYGIDMKEVARIWKGGCIIRAVLLDSIMEAFGADPSLPNLLLAEPFHRPVAARIPAWERVVRLAVDRQIPVPAFSASLAYFQGYRSKRGTAYLIQAQRDFFGAHTYQRIDREGAFHTDWERKGKD
ncbi:MAG: NADP-dependent phosphogluconate dehydrogenase [Acidobacteria bacterium]|nr:NADP-dependent phosphogluconate dehydrogenase [Acidobacteriota bacterium]